RPALGWRSGAGPDRLTRRARRGTPAAVHSPHPFHPPNCLPTMSLKILVVDDSPTERWFLADLIAKGGYQVTTAANGEEALEMVRSNPPSLIVLDVVMPGQSGFQLTRTLARDPETQAIPIILCSSKN